MPQALLDIAEKMQAIQSLEVDMEQVKELAAFGEQMRSEGTLAFRRPKQLELKLHGAGGGRVVINGSTMLVHYKALNKTDITDLRKDARSQAVAEHLFLLLRAEPAALANIYRLEMQSTSPVRVRLLPKSPQLASIMRFVDAEFDARGFVKSLRIVENNDDETRWLFKKPRINTAIDDGRFRTQTP